MNVDRYLYNNINKELIYKDLNKFSKDNSLCSVNVVVHKRRPRKTNNTYLKAKKYKNPADVSVYRMVHAKLNSIHKKNQVTRRRRSKAWASLIVINNLNCKRDVKPLVDELLSKNQYFSSSSIYVLVSASDDDEDSLYTSKPDMENNMEIANGGTALKENLTTSFASLKIYKKGQEYYFDPDEKRYKRVNPQVASEESPQNESKNLKTETHKKAKPEGEECQVTEETQPKQEKKCKIACTDTLVDRPCVCSKESQEESIKEQTPTQIPMEDAETSDTLIRTDVVQNALVCVLPQILENLKKLLEMHCACGLTQEKILEDTQKLTKQAEQAAACCRNLKTKKTKEETSKGKKSKAPVKQDTDEDKCVCVETSSTNSDICSKPLKGQTKRAAKNSKPTKIVNSGLQLTTRKRKETKGQNSKLGNKRNWICELKWPQNFIKYKCNITKFLNKDKFCSDCEGV